MAAAEAPKAAAVLTLLRRVRSLPLFDGDLLAGGLEIPLSLQAGGVLIPNSIQELADGFGGVYTLDPTQHSQYSWPVLVNAAGKFCYRFAPKNAWMLTDGIADFQEGRCVVGIRTEGPLPVGNRTWRLSDGGNECTLTMTLLDVAPAVAATRQLAEVMFSHPDWSADGSKPDAWLGCAGSGCADRGPCSGH